MRMWTAVLGAAVPPLAMAALVLGHPHLTDLDGSAWWLNLHLIGLASFPLLALGPWLAVRGRGRLVEVTVAVLGVVYAGFYLILDLLAALGDPSATTAAGPGPWVTGLFGDSRQVVLVGVAAYVVAILVAGTAVVAGTDGPTRVVSAVGSLIALGAAVAFLAGQLYYPVGVVTTALLALGQTLLAAAGQRGEPAPALSHVAEPSDGSHSRG